MKYLALIITSLSILNCHGQISININKVMCYNFNKKLIITPFIQFSNKSNEDIEEFVAFVSYSFDIKGKSEINKSNFYSLNNWRKKFKKGSSFEAIPQFRSKIGGLLTDMENPEIAHLKKKVDAYEKFKYCSYKKFIHKIDNLQIFVYVITKDFNDNMLKYDNINETEIIKGRYGKYEKYFFNVKPELIQYVDTYVSNQ